MKCSHSNLTPGCAYCLKLQRDWNKKLEKDTPNIEQEDGNLKQWHSFHFARKLHFDVQADKEEYFRLAGHFLHEFSFETERDRRIWELHADGHHAPAVVKKLAKQGFKVRASIVHEAVKRLSKTMLEKLWIS